MKRKRLNHFGDAVIGILTGYQVLTNADYFTKYGQGDYELDLLTEKLKFNGSTIESFPIFLFLQKWFNNEIIKNKIDKNFITLASIELKVGPPTGEKIRIETKWLFFKRVVEIDRYDYKIIIKLNLKTDEKDYSKQGIGAIWK